MSKPNQKPKPPPCPMCGNANSAVFIRAGEYLCQARDRDTGEMHGSYDDDPGTDVGHDPLRNLIEREERQQKRNQQRRRR